jgi:hypothetical protein
MQAHPFTHNALIACAAALAAALAAPVAHADIFTWTDATGRLNISNVAPPKDTHARRIVQEDPPKPAVPAPSAEVAALKERVAELESEVDRAKQASAPPPPTPIVVAPQVVVAPQPASPVAYAPPAAYAPLDVAPCDPLMFGCPAFGLPVNVVVVRTPRFHRFHRGHDLVRRASVVPARPNFGMVPARPNFGPHHR